MGRWSHPNPPRPDQIDLARPIDWSHPQARGLVAYWPFWLARSISQAYLDRALGRYAMNAGSSDPSLALDPAFGPVASFNGSSNYLLHNAAFLNRGCTMCGWVNSDYAGSRQSVAFTAKATAGGTDNLIGLALAGDVAGGMDQRGLD